MNPSLLLIPDRYKASKLYSQIPDSGAGDLAFTRALDTATRVNSVGLIEKVRTNLFAYSQEFNDAYWSKSGGGGAAAPVVTANNTSAPDGTNTAEKIDLPALSGTQFSIISREPSVSGIHNASVFLRGAVGGEVVYLFWTPDGVNYVRTSCTLTTAWQRFNLNATTATNWGFGVGVDLRDSSQDDQAAQTFFIWGAQLEAGDIATPYIPTTTAAVSVGMLANIPRIDYTGGGCGKLLLEPQRTNVALFSEQFNNAYWVKEFATISANTTATLDPSGYNSADKLQEDNTNNSHVFGNDSISALSGQSVTLTIFAKAAERNWLALRLYDGGSSKFAFYNLLTGTLGNVTAGATTTISPYGNGWFRCSMTITMAGNSVTLPYVFTSTGNGTTNYVGTTGNGIYVWGIQQEVGAYPTSYIPTLGASVTRSADSASKTGISSLIGQTSGTIYWESNQVGGAQFALNTTNSVSSDGIQIYGSGNNLAVYIQQGGLMRLNTSVGSVTQGTNFKIALAYGTNFVMVYINGVQTYTTTATIPMPTLTMLNLSFYGGGGAAAISETKAAALYTSILSPAELASLTTL